jgi:hypothetical protein
LSIRGREGRGKGESGKDERRERTPMPPMEPEMEEMTGSERIIWFCLEVECWVVRGGRTVDHG